MADKARRSQTGSLHAEGISVVGITPGQRRRDTFRGGEIAEVESHVDLLVGESGVQAKPWRMCVDLAPCCGKPDQTLPDAASASVSLDQRP